MICPNCRMEIPDGSINCPACGYPFAQQPQVDYYVQQPQNNYYAQQPQVPAKNNNGLIIGLIISGIVAIVAVVCLIILVLQGNDDDKEDYNDNEYSVFEKKYETNGKYVCSTLSSFGMDIYLYVDGRKVEMVMTYDEDGDGRISGDERESVSGTIEFDGDTCTINIEGDSMECAYDKKESTITMSDEDMMGMELVFEKE